MTKEEKLYETCRRAADILGVEGFFLAIPCEDGFIMCSGQNMNVEQHVRVATLLVAKVVEKGYPIDKVLKDIGVAVKDILKENYTEVEDASDNEKQRLIKAFQEVFDRL